ncbi:MAG: hypothetical protein IKD21_01300 [Clostridia bacterium]|nr:hypothetical protein [Clostridia bacterium]
MNKKTVSGKGIDLPNRKPTRLKGYDYSAPGAYFVTLCTHNHKQTLSKIVGAIHESLLQRHRSIISKAMGYLKMNASKQIHILYDEKKIWQRSFHDHIIRDKQDYLKIWNYIDTNIIKWEQDCFYNSKTES